LEKIFGGYLLYMDEKILLQKIKEIAYAVPSGLYKYSKPDQYWDDVEWAETPSMEKGYILIRELVENADIEEYNKKCCNDKEKDQPDLKVLNLGHGPTFWTHADEDMFFNAIYSLASYEKVVGEGRDLYLYYHGQLSNEEKAFLVGLLKRYNMKIPKELKEV
jgi:hypothetical protein